MNAQRGTQKKPAKARTGKRKSPIAESAKSTELIVDQSHFNGHLIAGDTKHPLSGYRIHVSLLREGSKPIDLGYDLTSSAGLFTLPYPKADQKAQTKKRQNKKAIPVDRFSFNIWNPAGEKFYETRIDWSPQQNAVARIVVPRSKFTKPHIPSIQEIAKHTAFKIPSSLSTALDRKGIKTLADIRQKGGMRKLTRLQVGRHQTAIATLDALTNLEPLTPDLQVGAKLIQNQFMNISQIAATTRADFVNTMGPQIGDAEAFRLHTVAVTQAKFLDGVAVGYQVLQAEGRVLDRDWPTLQELLPPWCHCEDCEAAVSPLAYLADLLDYVVHHVKDNGTLLTMQTLITRWYQPFDRLPATCEALNEEVSQVRICIEVLRSYLLDHPSNRGHQQTLQQAEQYFRRAAYSRFLSQIGTTYEELRLTRAADQATKDRLAGRLGVPTLRLNSFLQDPTTVTETWLAQHFGLPPTTGDPLAPRTPSHLEQWRLESLAYQWEQEDFPTDLPPDNRPLIDPDLIGPDDFRNPAVKANPQLTDRAFDIWDRRQRWVDTQVNTLLDPLAPPRRLVRGQREPDYLSYMFGVMYQRVAYMRTRRTPWSNTPLAQFDSLTIELLSGDAAVVKRARDILTNDLGLNEEAFQRVQELREKDRQWVQHGGNQPLSDEERRDLVYILTQSIKARFFDRWRQEERNIEFGPTEFWISGREPADGDWPPIQQAPLIDPELVSQRDLPEWVAGERAQTLWSTRRDELDQIYTDLQTERETNGLASAIARALADQQGRVPDLDNLQTQLNDVNPAVAERARTEINDRLRMTIEAFARVMEVRAREAGANLQNPPPAPSARDWADVYAILTTAQKLHNRYGDWGDEENNPPAGDPLPYWFALKARLPRWRADVKARTDWQEALRARYSPPLIDPDVVERGDLIAPWRGAAAYDLYRKREIDLRTFQSNLHAQWSPVIRLMGLDVVARQVLDYPSQVFLDFATEEEMGNDISGRLVQLNLLRPEYTHILRVRRLIDAGQPVLDSEWLDLEAMLTNVHKRRLSAQWRKEEQQAHITIRPELFVLQEDEVQAPNPEPGSRKDLRARRIWRTILSTRYEQRQGVLNGLTRVVRAVEEALLPQLRNALILATTHPNVPDSDVEAKGKLLTNQLLIDTRIRGCQITTRISQAISTLQGLIWSIRTGQLRDTYPNLALDDDAIDERWKWIGSYSTWRAAMFVHLYPENILVPALRRNKTQGFLTFLKEVRQKRRRIGPDEACRIAETYASYYRDIIDLEIEASCHAETNMNKGTCRSRTQGGSRILTYWFGRSPITGNCYMSNYDVTDPPSQSLWVLIPALTNAIEVLGAVPFVGRSPAMRMILVFVKVREEDSDKLRVARFNLDNPGWIDEPISLKGPEDRKYFQAVVVQQRVLANPSNSPASAPRVLFLVDDIEIPGRSILYENRVHPDGKRWEKDDGWDIRDEFTNSYRSLLAAVPVPGQSTSASAPYFVFYQTGTLQGSLSYKIYGVENFPETHSFGTPSHIASNEGSFLGAFLWPIGDKVYVYWKPKDRNSATQVMELVQPQSLNPDLITNIKQFNQWLVRAVNLSLAARGISLVSQWTNSGLRVGIDNLYHLLTLPESNHARKQMGEDWYRAYGELNIGLLEAYIKGQMLNRGEALDAWQLADKRVRANSQPSLGIADCLRRLFSNRFPGPTQPVSLRNLDPSTTLSTPSLSNVRTIARDSGPADEHGPLILALSRQSGDFVRAAFTRDPGSTQPVVSGLARIVPKDDHKTVPTIAAAWPGTSLAQRRKLIEDLYRDHLPEPPSNLVYIEEYYYSVPIQIAMELQRNGHYVAALDWFRTVYDYTELPGRTRKIWYGLVHEETFANSFTRLGNWLLDPLHPHAIAETRINTYTRFTLMSVIRCFLAYADNEFTRDTSESLERARTLYLTALELLASEELRQESNRCDKVIGTIDVQRLGDPSWKPIFNRMIADLSHVDDLPRLSATIDTVQATLRGSGSDEVRIANARKALDAALTTHQPRPTFGEVLNNQERVHVEVRNALMADERVASALNRIGTVVTEDSLQALSLVSKLSLDDLGKPRNKLPWLRVRVSGVEQQKQTNMRGTIRIGSNVLLAEGNGGSATGLEQATLAQLASTRKMGLWYQPGIAYQFCIPPNPILRMLHLHAALNLYKLRTCRNIAGMQRQVEPYAAETDTTSGMPLIGADGQLILPGLLTFQPTPYRFEILLSRAKELVQLAGNIEGSMLSAIQRRSEELYKVLTARQDIQLTKAGVQLQDFRLQEAEGGVELAELEGQRTQFQVDHYNELMNENFSTLEEVSMALQITIAGGYLAAALALISPFGPGGAEAAAKALEYTAKSVEATTNILSQYASFERRRQEWEFQRDLAEFALDINAQQVTIAKDHVRVVGQERRIAQMQSDYAEQTVEFLGNKFDNAELYDWMSNVLEGVYSFFLQQATAQAKLALAQLAFERQQIPPPVILDDYWEVPNEDFVYDVANVSAPNRRGLTGSARLLQDIHQLEQIAFETRERKLELRRTISLGRLAPIEFEQFRRNGVLTFATPMNLFDYDFPGHYLRQIKKVRITVFALIPPGEGIRATLTSSRISRIVLGGDLFQTVRIERGPEQVALTSTRDGTGLLELEAQSDLLRPFEGIGVDTIWEFRMPKASNPIDYSTIADVLMTIEYTALNSFDYREQVIRDLSSSFSADRPFSFRHQFADAWYDFNNPELVDDSQQMVVSFTTTRADFPPNLDSLTIRHIGLYFSQKDGVSFEVPVRHLHFTPEGGSRRDGEQAVSVDGIISTRRGNAPSWGRLQRGVPFGIWELALPNTLEIKNRFKNEEIQNMLFVITYTGQLPKWPT
ncbi:MAG TPA: hypothetical protein PKK23_10690 [Nitrospirales bacterium]|nr:hypothetical protein [Nitrospiraceae bacterium]HNP29505.1 hypothetical protein [Nitrospirales bacterium]